MRPVNLIPPEDRRGSTAPLRTGPLPYVLLGALVALLAGVTALVTVGNQISEREGEVAKLEREDAQAAAKAQRLAAYTEFRAMSEQRVATVSELADSRFDWERVMRELSLILPDDAWLVCLSGTASPNAAGGEGGSEPGAGTLRGSAAGPALEIQGCASGQEAVAGFVTALKDIDGVTRVGVESSELGEEDSSASAAGSGEAAEGGSSDCQTRDFIAHFSLLVAFDAAPVPVSATPTEAAPAPEESETAEEGEG
jgi:Tfp pilus assembly protein PilN